MEKREEEVGFARKEMSYKGENLFLEVKNNSYILMGFVNMRLDVDSEIPTCNVIEENSLIPIKCIKV